jgi:hypothetical protein
LTTFPETDADHDAEALEVANEIAATTASVSDIQRIGILL